MNMCFLLSNYLGVKLLGCMADAFPFITKGLVKVPFPKQWDPFPCLWERPPSVIQKESFLGTP